MSIRCKSVCVDGALTRAENLQSNEENEKSLYFLAGFLPLVVFFFFFLLWKHCIGLNRVFFGFFFLKVLDFPIIKKRHCGLCCSYLKSNNSNKLMGGPRSWQCCPGESPEPKTTAPQTQRGSEQLLWLAARWVLPKISSSLEIAHVCIIHVWNSSLQLENHKAAINKWNSGENPFRNIMHAFSVVY